MLAHSHTGAAAGFLVDGFPRNKDNLDGWQCEMATKADVLFVLVLHAPLEVCVKRCLNRGQGRADDNEVRQYIIPLGNSGTLLRNRCESGLSPTMNTLCPSSITTPA
jgi:hypothetical protein